jgi:hypothetical protein
MKRGTMKKNRKSKSKSRRVLRGGGCANAGKVVSIKNAMNKKGCVWTRTSNGKAKLANANANLEPNTFAGYRLNTRKRR